MPSANRFSLLRATVRNHPIIVSTSAATAGVLLGGFVAVQLFAAPPLHDKAVVAQANLQTTEAPKPAIETTGAAPAGDSAVSTDCEQQTWPNLSRVCIEEVRSKNRNARVITLDKPTHAESETQPSAPIAAASPAMAAEPPAPAPVVASTQAAAPEPAITAAAPPAVSASGSPAAETSPPPSMKRDVRENRVAKKRTSKPKVPAKQNLEDDHATLASVDSDDGDADDRPSRRRFDRAPRIVERWTERDYDVPDSRGGRRQVTVIRRDHGGRLFESLFGD